VFHVERHAPTTRIATYASASTARARLGSPTQVAATPFGSIELRWPQRDEVAGIRSDRSNAVETLRGTIISTH
jgi:hypothetical protein